ncbi:hypothetical protein GGR88_001530 [Sphingomonas jejuensis]|uniref:Probable membrane transporter protein n=1 Tax=Sphingomonas jejuensis TaxID=904715 RepID=A0ABX0XMY7_9SPHN|nr:sulfite exporter TauE/SafE family protein [Sphingomonas jejuensis]NJC34056.1 hypothetical protein [Sphingomonas jejuensis]
MPELAGIDIAAILPFVLVGFAAQIVDGAVGMAFGVIASTMLVSGLGVPPARASAGVHLAEMFTTAASGISHALHGNVDWRLFARLVIPGVIGGVLGAYVLMTVHAEVARPIVMSYLAVLGGYLLWRSFRGHRPAAAPRFVAPLGLVGGFLDAGGGGGWGPVVTSNLLAQGTAPRTTIGTVNTAEFFLTTVISVTFILGMGFEAFTTATVGVLIGGVLAAPFGALLVKRVRPMLLLRVVGVVLVITSGYSLYTSLA